MTNRQEESSSEKRTNVCVRGKAVMCQGVTSRLQHLTERRD